MTGDHGGQEAALRRILEDLWRELAGDRSHSDPGTLRSAELALLSPAGPLRLASDPYGLPHLLVPLKADAEDVEDRRSAGVHLTTRTLLVGEDPVRFLDLQCRRTALSGVFTGLVADICVVLARSEGAPEHVVPATLEAWRELLGGQPRWTPQRLAGLYGELLVLEHLLALDPGAADTWTGPAGAAQDFRNGSNAIEVKTTTSAQGRVIRIHGLEQLVRPPAGSLRIVWFRLAVSAQGESDDDIPSIIERCLTLAEPNAILSRLDRLGFPGMSSPEARAASFTLADKRIYLVDDQFPRITPEGFISGVVPPGISGVEYLVDLDTVASAGEGLDCAARHFLGAQ